MGPLLPSDWAPWIVMWSVAAAIFAVCKALSLQRAEVPDAAEWRRIAYLFAWPGLDAPAFLNPKPLPHDKRPTLFEWLFATLKLGLGVLLIWFVAPLIPADQPVLFACIGMTGVVFVLHFGLFHLLSCAWRATGVDAKPIMVWPILAVSVSEFWGKRWNSAFRDLTHRFLFKPLARHLGGRSGLAAGFLFSGLVHDLVISIPAGGGYGLPTLYFTLQGMGLLAERSRTGRSLGLGSDTRGRLFTAIVVAGPVGLLFHRPFIDNVVLPFLHAIGAC